MLIFFLDNLSGAIFHYGDECYPSPTKMTELIGELEEEYAEDGCNDMHCMIGTHVSHNGRVFEIAHSSAGFKNGFVIHELYKLIGQKTPIFFFEESNDEKIARNMVTFNCEDQKLKETVQYVITKLAVPATSDTHVLTPYPMTGGYRSRDITGGVSLENETEQTLLTDNNSQKILSLYRACRSYLRMEAGEPISKNKGLSCRNFSAYAYQCGILKVLFPDGLPENLKKSIASIEHAKRNNREGLSHSLSLTENIDLLMNDFVKELKKHRGKMSADYLDILMFDAKGAQPFEFMALLNRSPLFSDAKLIAQKDNQLVAKTIESKEPPISPEERESNADATKRTFEKLSYKKVDQAIRAHQQNWIVSVNCCKFLVN